MNTLCKKETREKIIKLVSQIKLDPYNVDDLIEALEYGIVILEASKVKHDDSNSKP